MMQIKALVNFNREKDAESGKVKVKHIPVTINVTNLTAPKDARQIVLDTLTTAGLKDFDIHERIEVQYMMEV